MPPRAKASTSSSTSRAGQATARPVRKAATKRKALSPSSDEEEEDEPTPARAKKEPVSKKAKTTAVKKVNNKKAIVVSEDDEDDEVEIIEVAAPSTAKAKVKPKASSSAPKKAVTKKVVEKKDVAKKVVAKKVAAPAVVVAAESDSDDAGIVESNDQEVARKAITKKKAIVSKPKPAVKKSSPVKGNVPPKLTFDQECRNWFNTFSKLDEGDADVMEGEGIEALFNTMSIGMDTIHPFLLAFMLKAKPGSFGSFKYSDWIREFSASKISNSSALATKLKSLEANFYPNSSSQPHDLVSSDKEDDFDPYGYPIHATQSYSVNFAEFYKFIFGYLKEEGQKSLKGEMAIALWSVCLVPKYPLASSFVEFVTELGPGFKGVSADVWSQLLDFVKTVGDDLTGYSDEEAWPSTLDSFVEWKRVKLLAAASH